MKTSNANSPRYRHKKLLAIPAIVTALAVLGCSEKPATTNTAAPPAKAAVGPTEVPQSIDRNRPLSSYQALQTAQQTVVLYHALNNAPLNLDKLVEGYSKEYRETPDAFKKKELFAKLTPEIEAAVAQARQNRYFMIEVTPESMGYGVKSTLEHYDFDKKGFPIKAFVGAKTKDEYQAAADNGRTTPTDLPGAMLFPPRTYGDKAFAMLIENAAAFKIASLPDLERAKAIEDLVTKKEPISMRLYAYATTTSTSFMAVAPAGHIRFEVLKIEFIDRNKQVLFAV